QAAGGRSARVAADDRQGRGVDRGGHHRSRAGGDRAARGGGGCRGDRPGLAAGQVEDGEPVRRGHHAHPREGARLPGVPCGGHRRAVGRAGPDAGLRRGLLLPVLPQGGLPRHRARRRPLVVNVLAVIAAYLVGAVPIGWLVARAFGVGDIRRQGSGTIGATNVLRTAGPLPAIATLVGDVLKGYLAVVLGTTLGGGDPTVSAAAAVAAVAGNCWSVFLGFRGGKGVATGLGALLYLAPWATLAAVPVFVVIVASFRYVSL